MGRSPCCSKEGLNRGAWTATEDKLLVDFINKNGEGRWRSIPKEAGLKRCGKSCRLRWLNYLRPDIKRGNITHDEEDLIIRLHRLLGNRWSLIAGRLPGRTDNEIKNYWNTTLLKKIRGEQNPNLSSDQNTKKKTNKTKPGADIRTTTTNKAVRTKAVRCSKVVLITPPNVSDECVSLCSRDDDTSFTTSGEDYSNLPMDFSGVFATGDPVDGGSDPDFWNLLNDWIMDDNEANCHS